MQFRGLLLYVQMQKIRCTPVKPMTLFAGNFGFYLTPS